MKNLLLVTAGFPYGKSETFLENELPIVAKGFERVTILAIGDGAGERRFVPENCKVHHLDLSDTKKIQPKALSLAGSPIIRKERKWIKKKYAQKVEGQHHKIMLMSLAKAKMIAKWIKKKLMDGTETVAYSYWGDDAAIALALLQRKHFFGKAICRAHRWDLYPNVQNFPYLPFRSLMVDHLDEIHSISDDGFVAIEKDWKCSTAKVVLSRLGVKKQVNVAQQSTRLLLSCANLIPVKRVNLIIQALQHVSFPINWIHFGDGVEMEQLMKAAESLPENVQVTWKGRVANQEVLSFYRAHHPTAFINVSSSEGVPVSIMEAFSFGIPVIATDVGGNGEIVNNENGILLAAHPSEKEVAQAITSVFEASESDYAKKSKAAFATWEKDYNAEKNYEGFVGGLLK
jgi:glycosyltransferase involved in cell wall biosynthesis